jgi:hypothetical protein
MCSGTDAKNAKIASGYIVPELENTLILWL